MISLVGERADGSLLGEDENGNLYRGTIRRVGWDQVERRVIDKGDRYELEYHVGDYIVSVAHLAKITDEEMETWIAEVKATGDIGSRPSGFNPKYMPYHQHKTAIQVPMPDGTTQEFERLIDVKEWEAL